MGVTGTAQVEYKYSEGTVQEQPWFSQGCFMFLWIFCESLVLDLFWYPLWRRTDSNYEGICFVSAVRQPNKIILTTRKHFLIVFSGPFFFVAEPLKQSKSFHNGLLGPKEGEKVFNKKWLYFDNDELPDTENFWNRRSRRDLSFLTSPDPWIEALGMKIDVSGPENCCCLTLSKKPSLFLSPETSIFRSRTSIQGWGLIKKDRSRRDLRFLKFSASGSSSLSKYSHFRFEKCWEPPGSLCSLPCELVISSQL